MKVQILIFVDKIQFIKINPISFKSSMSFHHKSNIIHEQDDQNHKEDHMDAGEYLKSSVYGGLDGVVNTLTVILGGIAAGTPPTHILAIGISVLIGDGLGMGLGDYLSAKAEKQFILSEEKRQFWEVENKLQDEKEEVIEIYTKKGYTKEQSQRIADLYSTNDQAFVNIMMLEELGLVVDDSSPFWGGVVTFFAFAIFGLLPLIPYIISAGINHDDQKQYLLIAIIVGGVELFSLGFAKAMLVGLNKFLSGAESLALGAFAVGVGYSIGLAFNTDQNSS